MYREIAISLYWYYQIIIVRSQKNLSIIEKKCACMSNDYDKIIKENIEKVEQLIDAIINRLTAVSGSEIVLQKYARQLAVLSRLRNLEEVVTKTQTEKK